jgi:cysteine-rich repeat protein
VNRFVLLLSWALSLAAGCPSTFVAVDGATPCETHDDCSDLGDSVGCFLPAGQASGYCVTYCGDGVLRQDIDQDGDIDPGDPGFEACDDGNSDDYDGCTNTCQLARCGDGLLRTDLAAEHSDYEACDDGNSVDTDACLNVCTLARCGDGVLRELGADEPNEGSEECDDGNEVSNDGCAECYATLDFVHLRGGTYLMGSDGAIFGDEAPRHSVTVEPIYFAKHEVTVSLYRRCIRGGGCPVPSIFETHLGSELLKDCNYSYSERALHPMNCITLPEIDAFRAWYEATYQQTVRLPTEAEWEYAARSRGLDRLNPWGNQPASCEFAVIENGCGADSTLPVCSHTEGNSDDGLCDLIGNVWEWTQDRYHPTYDEAPADGSAWLGGSSSLQVMRGGSWMDDDQRFLRSAVRMGINPHPMANGIPFDLALPILGFRLVIEP